LALPYTLLLLSQRHTSSGFTAPLRGPGAEPVGSPRARKRARPGVDTAEQRVALDRLKAQMVSLEEVWPPRSCRPLCDSSLLCNQRQVWTEENASGKVVGDMVGAC